MVDNIQIPNDVTKIFEIKMTDKPLRDFLVSLLNRINQLEKRITELES